MRNCGAAGILMLVSRNQSLNIRCEIDSLEESFRGELENEQGVSRSFSGWTEFASALMALARDTTVTNNKQDIEEKTS
ncbi:MAG: hypothetical protein M3Y23_04130 [Actinomycetota bacterium]|nr:hypothetical protein [Actinomycetota bacterium]